MNLPKKSGGAKKKLAFLILLTTIFFFSSFTPALSGWNSTRPKAFNITIPASDIVVSGTYTVLIPLDYGVSWIANGSRADFKDIIWTDNNGIELVSSILRTDNTECPASYGRCQSADGSNYSAVTLDLTASTDYNLTAVFGCSACEETVYASEMMVLDGGTAEDFVLVQNGILNWSRPVLSQRTSPDRYNLHDSRLSNTTNLYWREDDTGDYGGMLFINDNAGGETTNGTGCMLEVLANTSNVARVFSACDEVKSTANPDMYSSQIYTQTLYSPFILDVYNFTINFQTEVYALGMFEAGATVVTESANWTDMWTYGCVNGTTWTACRAHGNISEMQTDGYGHNGLFGITVNHAQVGDYIRTEGALGNGVSRQGMTEVFTFGLDIISANQSFTQYLHTPKDFTVYGEVESFGSPPTLSGVAVNSTSPDFNSTKFDIVATFVPSDTDVGDTLTCDIEWMVDSITITTFTGEGCTTDNLKEFTLSVGNYSQSKLVSAAVRVYDQTTYSAWSNTSQVTILNNIPTYSPPEIGSQIRGFNSSTHFGNGLVGYWEFERNATDLSGNGNDGDPQGVTNTTEGRIAGAYKFDGVDDYVNVSNSSSIAIEGNSDISIAIWIKVVAENGELYPGIFNRRLNEGYGLYIDAESLGGDFVFIIGSSGVSSNRVDSLINPVLNRWYHVVSNYNKTDIMIYIDGVKEATKSTSSSIGIPTAEGDLFFGADSTGASNFFNGTMDSVAIWNRSLSSDEVYQLYSMQNETYTNQDLTVSPQELNDTDGDVIISSFKWYNQSSLKAMSVDPSDPDLVLYLPMDGGNTSDFSLQNNFGTIDGADCGVEGKVLGACSFDGVDDYVNITQNDLISGNDLTLGIWFLTKNALQSNGQILLGRNDISDGTKYTIQILSNSGNIIYDVANSSVGGIIDDNITVTANLWHQIIMTYNFSTISLYYDGIISSSTFRDQILGTETAMFRIGAQDYGGANRYFNGSLDDVAVWNRSLSSDEVYSLFQGGRSGGQVLHKDQSVAGENVTVGVRVCDEYDCGGELNSSVGILLVGNSVPTVSGLAVNSSSPSLNDTLSDLEVSFVPSDADLTDTLSCDVEWMKDNVVFLTFSEDGCSKDVLKTFSLTSANFSQTDLVSASVRVFDGTDLSDWSNSSQLEILNVVSTQSTPQVGAVLRGFDTSNLWYGEGLVGYWEFERNATDLSGNGNHGDPIGVTNTSEGRIAGAYKFDGVDDNIIVNDIASLDFGTNSFTISAWAYHTQSKWQVVVGKSKHTTADNFRAFIRNDDRLQLFYGTDSQPYTRGEENLSVKRWNHLIWGVNNETGNVFYAVNGIYEEYPITIFNVSNNENLIIGDDTGSASDYSLNGTIDSVAIWNRSLTSDEVYALYSMQNETYTNQDLTVSLQDLNDTDGDVVVSSFKWYNQSSLKAMSVDPSDPDLVLYLPMDGGNTSDFSLQNNFGTVNDTTNGANCNAEGKILGSCSFDGVNDYLSVVGSSLAINGNLTLSVWIKQNSFPGSFMGIISGSDGSTLMPYSLRYGAGDYILQFIIRTTESGSLSTTTNVSYSFTDWGHAVGVYDGVNMITYFNGIERNSTAQTGSIVSASNGVSVGANYENVILQFYDGNIDDVAVWNRSLSSDEVFQLYQGGRSGGQMLHSDQSFYGENLSVEGKVCDEFGCSEGLNSTDFLIVNSSVPVVSLTSPPDADHDSLASVSFDFVVLDDDVDSCSFYHNVTGVWGLNQSDSSITADNVTVNSFSLGFSSNDYYSFGWNVECNDTVNGLHFASSNFSFTADLTPPIVTWFVPNNDNSSIFTGDYFLSADLNNTDLFAFDLNVSALNGSVIYSNYSQTLDPAYHRIEDFLNLSDLGEFGLNYTVDISVSDSHTSSQIQDYEVSVKDNNLSFVSGNNLIEISVQDVFPQGNGLTQISTIKGLDRYEIIMDFNGNPPNRVLNLSLKTAYPLTFLENSSFRGHFVSLNLQGGEGNWIDFETVDGIDLDYEVTVVDGYTAEIVITSNKSKNSFHFKSVGGLNIVEESRSFMYHQVPQINITAPEDGAILTDRLYQFHYNVSVENTTILTGCMLRVDNVSVVNVSEVYDGMENNISYEFPSDGFFSYTVSCDDALSTTGFGQNYTLTIDTTAGAFEDPSTMGGGIITPPETTTTTIPSNVSVLGISAQAFTVMDSGIEKIEGFGMSIFQFFSRNKVFALFASAVLLFLSFSKKKLGLVIVLPLIVVFATFSDWLKSNVLVMSSPYFVQNPFLGVLSFGVLVGIVARSVFNDLFRGKHVFSTLLGIVIILLLSKSVAFFDFTSKILSSATADSLVIVTGGIALFYMSRMFEREKKPSKRLVRS